MTIETMNSNKTRFDLEEQIMDCWGVVDDIKVIYSMPDLREMSEDELQNALLGVMTLYQMKFEKLQDTFQVLIKEGKII